MLVEAYESSGFTSNINWYRNVNRNWHLLADVDPIIRQPALMIYGTQDMVARKAFQQIARLSGGAFCTFDASSAKQLRELLSAVAVFAAGGRPALADYSRKTGGLVPQITHQIK